MNLHSTSSGDCSFLPAFSPSYVTAARRKGSKAWGKQCSSESDNHRLPSNIKVLLDLLAGDSRRGAMLAAIAHPNKKPLTYPCTRVNQDCFESI